MKKMILCLIYFFSFSCHASILQTNCSSIPTTDPNFCADFANLAYCYCAPHLGAGMCHQLKVQGIYQRFVSPWPNVDIACQHQKDFPDAVMCSEQWKKYEAICPPAL